MSIDAWHGPVPPDWTAGRLGYYFDVVLGKGMNAQKVTAGATDAPYLAAGSIQPEHLRLDETRTMPFTEAELASYSLKRGDVVVVEGGAGYGRSHLLAEDLPGWGFQNHVARLRARHNGVEPAYLLYCLKACLNSGYIEANNRTATLPSLSRDVLATISIPLPSHPEQQQIADYLDRETAQIDTLIEAQQQLVDTLRERRAAVVDSVVWKGLDKSAAMGPTGIDPAPLAPVHWLRRRNKDILRESTELSKEGTEELLTVSHLTGITTRASKSVNMIEAETLIGYRLVQEADLVINTMWAWMGALGVSTIEGVVSPAYGVYRPISGLDCHPAYFDHLYRSRPYIVEMTRHSRGIWESRLRLYPDVFLRLAVAIPPLEEQRAIADYLAEQTTKIDALITEAERFIGLSRERRSALITAAVTGQIDIRDAVA